MVDKALVLSVLRGWVSTHCSGICSVYDQVKSRRQCLHLAMMPGSTSLLRPAAFRAMVMSAESLQKPRCLGIWPMWLLTLIISGWSEGLQSIGSQTVGHGWSDLAHAHEGPRRLPFPSPTLHWDALYQTPLWFRSIEKQVRDGSFNLLRCCTLLIRGPTNPATQALVSLLHKKLSLLCKVLTASKRNR